MSIKLADFGLAHGRPDLRATCGTKQYIAPEIYLRSKYTTSVDLRHPLPSKHNTERNRDGTVSSAPTDHAN